MWKAEILISGILSYFNITLQNMCYTLNLQMELILRNNSARRFRTDESPLPFNWSLRSGRPVTLFRTPPPRRGVCCLHRRKPDYTGGSSSLPPHCSCAQLYLPRTKRGARKDTPFLLSPEKTERAFPNASWLLLPSTKPRLSMNFITNTNTSRTLGPTESHEQ